MAVKPAGKKTTPNRGIVGTNFTLDGPLNTKTGESHSLKTGSLPLRINSIQTGLSALHAQLIRLMEISTRFYDTPAEELAIPEIHASGHILVLDEQSSHLHNYVSRLSELNDRLEEII